MADHQLHPAALLADPRDDRRAWLYIDLATWPTDLPPEPLPPVPLIGIGPADHPQARRLDLLVDDRRALARLATEIDAAPLATAAVASLLRAIEALRPERALVLESLVMAALQGGREHRKWLARRPPVGAAAPGGVHVVRRDRRLDIVLDRPDALNAIDRGMRDALFDAFTVASLDRAIEAVRLRAVGRCFSIGADLAEFGTTSDPVEAHAIRTRTLPALPLLRRRGMLEAHVQGACVGAGLELAAFADRLTAGADAWFQLPETRMGLLPGFGGCVSVPRRIGRQRTAWLILSGRRIDARTALGWGLIDAIVDDHAVDQRNGHEIGR